MGAEPERLIKQAAHAIQSEPNSTGALILDSRSKMPLRAGPRVRLLPKLRRSWDLVLPVFRDTLLGLANGRLAWPLYLHGPTGGGKTRGSLLMCDHAESAVYFTVDSLCDEVMSLGPGDSPDFWGSIGSKSIGILDEVSARDRVNDLHFSVVKRFLDEREASDSRTIIISNKQPSEFHRLYDDRIASRALGGTILKLVGDDMRLAWKAGAK